MADSFLTQKTFAEKTIFFSLAALLIVLPFNEGGNGYILQFVTHLILLVCGTVWAIAALRRREIRLLFDWIALFVVGGIFWMSVSTYFADYKYAALFELVKLLSYAALFYLCRIFFPLNGLRNWLLGAIAASGALQLGVAVYARFIGGSPILQAGFVDPNLLACFWGIGANIALSFLLFHKTASNQSFPKLLVSVKIGAGMAAASFVLAILAINSRGAALGLAVTLAMLASFKKKYLGLVVIGIFCLALVIPFPGGSLLQRLSKRHDPLAYERPNIWKSSLRIAVEHPVFGVGPGMYAFCSEPYNFPLTDLPARYEKRLNVAHSDTLQIAAEQGFVGLLIFLGGAGWLLWQNIRLLRQQPVSWTTIAAFTGLLSVAIQGLFSTLLTSPAIAMSAALLAVIVIDRAGTSRQKIVRLTPSWKWYAVLALAVIYLLVPVIIEPFLGQFHYRQYQSHMTAKEFQAAVEHLKSSIKYAPGYAYSQHSLGKLYLAAFRNQPNLDAFYEGYTALTAAIRCNPKDFELYLNLAELHRAMFYQKLRTPPTAENALQAYQQARRLHPFHPFQLFSMATLHADLNQFDQAIALLQDAVKIEPNFVGGYQMLGKMLRHLQRTAEADRAIQQADDILRRYPNAASYSEYVRLLLRPIN